MAECPRCASTCTCRPSPAAPGCSRRCAAPTTASGTWTWWPACATRSPTCRSPPTSSSASPGETEARLRRDALAWSEECALRRGLHVPLLAPSGHRGRRSGWPTTSRRRSKRERIARLVEVVQATAARAGGPVRGQRARGAGRGAVAHRPLAAARAAAPEHHGQLRRRRRAGDAGDGAGRVGSTSTTLGGRQVDAPAPALVPPEVLALFGPTAAGKSALAHAAALALGGEIVVADPFQRYRGLEIAADSPRAAAAGRGAPPRGGRPRRSTEARPPAAFAARGARGDRRRPRRGAGAGRGRAAPGSTCARRSPTSGLPAPRPTPALRELGRARWPRTTRPRRWRALARPRPRRGRPRRRRQPAPRRAGAGGGRSGGAGRPAGELWSGETRRPTLIVGRHPAPRGARPPLSPSACGGSSTRAWSPRSRRRSTRPGLSREAAQIIGVREVLALRAGALERRPSCPSRPGRPHPPPGPQAAHLAAQDARRRGPRPRATRPAEAALPAPAGALAARRTGDST